MTLGAFDLLLVASCALLVMGAVSNRDGQVLSLPVDTRWIAVAGFGLLAVLWTGLAVKYLSESATSVFLAAVSVAALALSLQAIRLVVTGWKRSIQLTTTVAAILTIALPFELYPKLRIGVRETLAQQVATVASWLGTDPVITETASGVTTRIVFQNGGYLVVTPECTGIGAVALFAGLVMGTKTTPRRKLGGLALVLSVVYALNMIRMVFVSLAMANNWFAPLLGKPESLQTTYYVAEIALGQTFVIIASVAGFLVLSRLLPDMRGFVQDVVSSM